MNVTAEPRITRESIILRSAKGEPLLTFDTVDKAKRHNDKHPGGDMRFFKQTVTELEMVL